MTKAPLRLGVIWDSTLSAANYRAIDPMRAMERRGHTVVWPANGRVRSRFQDLRGCDVVHVHRCFDDETRALLSQLRAAGSAVTWDNDDDYTAIPPGSIHYHRAGGAAGQRLFGQTMKVARTASVVTTTSPVIAARFSEAGLGRVEVIENSLRPGMRRPSTRGGRLLIGWVAGLEHQLDADKLSLRPTFERLLDEHPDVGIESVGVDLRLRSDRYRHIPEMHFDQLPGWIGRLEIGIAPLLDIPFNHARSNIKVKEYAASGVPWLASPVGPYASLGASEGGMLVADDRWSQALSELIANRRLRRRLGRKGKSWAKRNTLDVVADRWVAVFREAAQMRA